MSGGDLPTPVEPVVLDCWLADDVGEYRLADVGYGPLQLQYRTGGTWSQVHESYKWAILCDRVKHLKSQYRLDLAEIRRQHQEEAKEWNPE